MKHFRPNESLKCHDFPCSDIKKDRHRIPGIDIKTENINTIMISEAPPENEDDYFYSQGNPFYMRTTVQAFNDAGFAAKNMTDVLRLGVYVTTAIKCSKTSYSISQETIGNCSSYIMEREITLFPRAKTILLMGETAMKAMNLISKKNTGKIMIPAGPTYKVRKAKYFYN